MLTMQKIKAFLLDRHNCEVHCAEVEILTQIMQWRGRTFRRAEKVTEGGMRFVEVAPHEIIVLDDACTGSTPRVLTGEDCTCPDGGAKLWNFHEEGCPLLDPDTVSTGRDREPAPPG
jgi:hypothetical protein